MSDPADRSAIPASVRRAGWRPVRSVELGTTALIHVVERGAERQMLKTARPGRPGARPLWIEYQVLRYLGQTAMRAHVPRVSEWLPEAGGFLMELVRCPSREETQASWWAARLAGAMRVLHSVRPPSIDGLEDDRPDVAGALCRRLGRLFQAVAPGERGWAGLPAVDRPALARVRERYAEYAALLPALGELLPAGAAALVHGDLAGDNLMLTASDRPALIDWGEARIGAPLADVAGMLSYAAWPQDEVEQFLALYFGSEQALAAARPALDLLGRLYAYRSCVQSLLWLAEPGSEGLDAVGRVHFERQMACLCRVRCGPPPSARRGF